MYVTRLLSPFLLHTALLTAGPTGPKACAPPPSPGSGRGPGLRGSRAPPPCAPVISEKQEVRVGQPRHHPASAPAPPPPPQACAPLPAPPPRLASLASSLPAPAPAPPPRPAPPASPLPLLPSPAPSLRPCATSPGGAAEGEEEGGFAGRPRDTLHHRPAGGPGARRESRLPHRTLPQRPEDLGPAARGERARRPRRSPARACSATWRPRETRDPSRVLF